MLKTYFQLTKIDKKIFKGFENSLEKSAGEKIIVDKGYCTFHLIENPLENFF